MPILLAPPHERTAARAGDLHVVLLNNLGDAGLAGGERQFRDVLDQACHGHRVWLRFVSLPSIERGAAARKRIEMVYTPVSRFRDEPVDGLFVTGAEPRAARLTDEAYWRDLAGIIDWAARNTQSAVWSCLAAHAAVHHLDGIERHRLDGKLSGIFAVERAGSHPLLAGMRTPLPVAHSRYNAVARADLAAAGYEILSHSPAVGADSFCRRQRDSLFVFLQGHPEYDPDALRREYRRDVGRFLDGSTTAYPALPVDVFDGEAEAALLAFARDARRGCRSGAMPAALLRPSVDRLQPRTFATILLRNWLDLLAEGSQASAARISPAICDKAGRAAAITPVRP